MTTASVCAPAERKGTLLPSVAWIGDLVRGLFRQRQAINDLERLDDRDLRDIGIERDDISAHVDAAMTRINLRQLGR